jgi:hypothetical protein
MPGSIPVVASVGTHTNSFSSTISVPVPTGVVADDIIVIPIFIDNNPAALTSLPSGFAHVSGSPTSVLPSGGSPNHNLAIVWKRATGNDTGTYDFTLSTATYRATSAIRITGCITSGSPWDSNVDWKTDSVSDNDTAPVSISTTGTNRLLFWAATDWSAGTWTVPSGFTKLFDAGDHVNTAATMDAAVAGSYGPYIGTSGVTNSKVAFLGALLPTSGTPAVITGSADLTIQSALGSVGINTAIGSINLSGQSSVSVSGLNKVFGSAALTFQSLLGINLATPIRFIEIAQAFNGYDSSSTVATTIERGVGSG